MTRFGSSRPALIRKAGQKIAWNREMSLPMTWTSAGQNLRNASDSASG